MRASKNRPKKMHKTEIINGGDIPAIKKIRLHLGMTQSQFAKLLGYSIIYIKKLESQERNISYDIARKLMGLQIPLNLKNEILKEVRRMSKRDKLTKEFKAIIQNSIQKEGIQNNVAKNNIPKEGIQNDKGKINNLDNGIQNNIDEISNINDGIQNSKAKIDALSTGIQNHIVEINNIDDGIQKDKEKINSSKEGIQNSIEETNNGKNGIQNNIVKNNISEDGIQNSIEKIEADKRYTNSNTENIKPLDDGIQNNNGEINTGDWYTKQNIDNFELLEEGIQEHIEDLELLEEVIKEVEEEGIQIESIEKSNSSNWYTKQNTENNLPLEEDNIERYTNLKKESTKERNIYNNLYNNSLRENIYNNKLAINIKNTNEYKALLEKAILFNIIHNPEKRIFLEEISRESLEEENKIIYDAIKKCDSINLYAVYKHIPSTMTASFLEDYVYTPLGDIDLVLREYKKELSRKEFKDKLIELLSKDKLEVSEVLNLVNNYKEPPEENLARIDKLVEQFPQDFFSPSNRLYTSLGELNEKINGGFIPGQYVLIASRPSVGKTSLMLNFMLDFARLYKKVIFFSLEQSEMEILHRLACMLAGKQINSYDELQEYLQELCKYDIYIYSGAYSVSKIDYITRRYHTDASAIFIDYFQLITPPANYNNLVQAYSIVSASLKQLAKETNTTLIVASQLNREIERRSDSSPKLSDLRETGALEQDGDVIIMLSKLAQISDHMAKIKINVVKNRNGPTGFIYAKFHQPSFRFSGDEGYKL